MLLLYAIHDIFFYPLFYSYITVKAVLKPLLLDRKNVSW